MHRLCFAFVAGAILIVTVLASTTRTAQAQSDNVVEIGGATLTLGDSRADTLNALRPRLRVLPSSTSGYYNLYRSSSGDSGPINSLAIGAIMIRGGRLVSVTRNLGSFQSPDGRAAIDNFIAVIAEASKDVDNHPVYDSPDEDSLPHLPQVMVNTDNERVGDDTSSRVYFTFPDRTVQLAVYQPARPGAEATVAISEQYSLRERRSNTP